MGGFLNRESRTRHIVRAVVCGQFIIAAGDCCRGGEKTENYPDGKPHFVYSVDRRGLKNGEFKEFDPAGQLLVAASYANGELSGSRRRFAGHRVVADEFWMNGQLIIPKGQQLIAEHLAAIQKMPVNVTGDFPRVSARLSETVRSRGFQAQQEAGLRTLAAYRFLADVPYDDLEIDRDDAAHAQAAAELLTKIGKLTHTPENPGLPDAEFQFAYKGTSSSNISTVGDAAGAVRLFMDDSDAANVAKLGHRRWCLNPGMLKTGFGADGKSSCMWSFDQSRKDGPDYDLIAYPPRGLLPTSYFKSGDAWSLSVNPKKYRTPESSVTVTLTAVRFDLEKLTLERGMKPLAMEFVTISHDGYGIPNCIIFRPKNVIIAADSTFMVSIRGLKQRSGQDAAIDYFVGFFALEK